MKLKAVSSERYNGGVIIKRLHGSSTVTVFLVWDEHRPERPSLKVKAYGKTPGERKTYALKEAERIINGQDLAAAVGPAPSPTI